LLGGACSPRSRNSPAQSVATAQRDSAVVTHGATAKSAPSPGFAWSIQGKSTVITLVGSIHIGIKALYPIPEPLEEAFRQSSVLAMELALDQESPETIKEMMLSQARLPEGKRLRDCLSDRTWLQYQSFVQDHSAQGLFLDQFHPWFVATFLFLEKEIVAGYDPDQGIDTYFYKHRGSRKVIGIEKAEQQIRAMAELPEATQDLMLAEQLEAMTKADDDLESLVKFWKKGDTEGLERELFVEFRAPEYAPVYEALIVQRNALMTTQIEKWLADKERVFVVLGAAHFIGKDGIIARLERDGWAPRRL
jgi:uncharacterized protein YbaP (TraB family)